MRLQQKQIILLISAAIITATLIAYEPIRHNDFVNYDDGLYITYNPKVTGGITRDSITWAFTQSHAFNWHPLTWLSHMLDYELFGTKPFGHHAVSVLIHIINAVLLLWLLTKMTGAIWPSAFVAAVFSLHPQQVESVAWASERKTVLCGLFWLLTMAAYIRYVKKPGIRRYLPVFVIYALGILTKPAIVTLPLVLLLLDYWPLNRGRKTEDGGQRTKRGVKILNLVLEKVPLLALSAILSAATFAAQLKGGTVVGLGKMALDFRIANAFISYIRYIAKFIWPSGLAVFYPYPPLKFTYAATTGCSLLLLLFTILSIYIGRRKKYVLVGWLWFAGTLVPMIGLVQAGAQVMADRYMYLSMLGLLIIIAWGVKDLSAARPQLKYIIMTASMAVLVVFFIMTRTQVGYWKSGKELWERALAVTKNNDIAENNYAGFLASQGNISEAERHYRNALRINSKYPDALLEFGNFLLRQKRTNEAIPCYQKLLLQGLGKAEIYFNLGAALGIQKKYGEAIKYIGEAIKLDPDYPQADLRMGLLLEATGKPAEAIPYLHKALPTDPNEAEIYTALGSAYNQTGREKEAIQSWNKAAQLEPNNPSVMNNLAWALATTKDDAIRDVNKAVELAELACKITDNKDPEFLDTLAASYAAAGRFEEAVNTATKAIAIAKAAGRSELAGKIESQLESYKKQQQQ